MVARFESGCPFGSRLQVASFLALVLMVLFCQASPSLVRSAKVASEGPLGCFHEMENIVGENEDAFHEEYASLLKSAAAADAEGRIRMRTVEAFLGHLFADWRNSRCPQRSGTALGPSLPLGGRIGGSLSIASHKVGQLPASVATESVTTPSKYSKKPPNRKAKTRPLRMSLPQECVALADLYDATNGPHWRRQMGWSNRTALLENCCLAYGVTCNSTSGHVESLVLISNDLRGNISSSISVLREIKEL